MSSLETGHPRAKPLPPVKPPLRACTGTTSAYAKVSSRGRSQAAGQPSPGASTLALRPRGNAGTRGDAGQDAEGLMHIG